MQLGGVEEGVMTTGHQPAGTPEQRRTVLSEPFDVFFREQFPKTVRLAHLLTGSNAAAEDLAQDAFAKVFSRLDRLDNPAAYLRTTTVNICRNWHRTSSRESDRFRRHGLSETQLSMESDELLDSIRRLSYHQQEVLVLRYWLDLSESDIARVLGCRAGTVKSRCSRALAALRTDLNDVTTVHNNADINGTER